MFKDKMLLWILLFSFIYASCEQSGENTIELPYEGRTLIMYLVADNDISSSLYNNLKDVVKGLELCRQKAEVVIYWDGYTSDPALLKYKVDEKGNVSQEKVLRMYEAQNSVDPEVMTKVFSDIFLLSPSKSYGLVMGSHALSWLPRPQVQKSTKTFGDDRGEEIEIPELAEVLSRVISKPLDFLIFDACFMSSIEVAYELRNIASYIIASPSEVLVKGFPYGAIMPLLFSNEITDYTRRVGEEFISYFDYESRARWGTIAAINCSELERLATVTKQILVNNSPELVSFEVSSLQKYDRAGLRETNFAFDFDHFIRTLATQEEYEVFKVQLGKTVIYKDMVESSYLFPLNRDNYSGIASYIMQPEKTYLNEYFKTLEWYSASGWSETNWD